VKRPPQSLVVEDMVVVGVVLVVCRGQ